jgi:hypothetical protein
MVCQTAALALHTLAAQAATRRRERSLTHVRPQPCALATPCPPRAHRCTSCSAVCPHWHRAPTDAHMSTILLRPAGHRPDCKRAHEERCVWSRIAHRTRDSNDTLTATAPHCPKLHHERTARNALARRQRTPARLRHRPTAWQDKATCKRTSDPMAPTRHGTQAKAAKRRGERRAWPGSTRASFHARPEM